MLGSSLFRTNSSNIDLYLHLPGNRKELVHVPPPSLIPSKHIEEGTVFNFCRGLQRITRIKPQFVHCYNSHIVFTGNYVNTIKCPYCGRRYTAVTSITCMKFPRAQAMYAREGQNNGPKVDHTLSPVLGSECMYLNRLSIKLSHLLEPWRSKVKLATASAIQCIRAWVKGFRELTNYRHSHPASHLTPSAGYVWFGLHSRLYRKYIHPIGLTGELEGEY